MSGTVTLDEVWKLFKETDRRLENNFKETDRQFKETDRQFKETDRKIERLSREIGNLTGKLGKFVEGMVIPSAVKIFSERGIPVHGIDERSKREYQGRWMEIDVIVENKEYVVAIEVKSTLSVEDVNVHIERLNEFKLFYPKYSDHKVIGAVAGMVFEEESDVYAYRKGLFVLAQSGDAIIIKNDVKFIPKTWGE